MAAKLNLAKTLTDFLFINYCSLPRRWLVQCNEKVCQYLHWFKEPADLRKINISHCPNHKMISTMITAFQRTFSDVSRILKLELKIYPTITLWFNKHKVGPIQETVRSVQSCNWPGGCCQLTLCHILQQLSAILGVKFKTSCSRQRWLSCLPLDAKLVT